VTMTEGKMSVDNPPAFPRAATDYDTWGHSGMTLRDYFAGQAIGDLISGRDWSGLPDTQEKVALWARAAYHVADAMLAARSAGEGK
jgi:hypothetical protein